MISAQAPNSACWQLRMRNDSVLVVGSASSVDDCCERKGTVVCLVCLSKQLGATVDVVQASTDATDATRATTRSNSRSSSVSNEDGRLLVPIRRKIVGRLSALCVLWTLSSRIVNSRVW